MNPEDFLSNLSKYSEIFNGLKSYYYDGSDTSSNWCFDGWRTDDSLIKSSTYKNKGKVFLKLISNKIQLFIERPNCEDLVNIKKLNPSVFTEEGISVPYVASFDEPEPESDSEYRSSMIECNNVEEINIDTVCIYEEIDLETYKNEFLTQSDYYSNFLNKLISEAKEDIKHKFNYVISNDFGLNPNLYNDKIEKEIEKQIKNFTITIYNEFDEKIAEINPETFKFFKLKEIKEIDEIRKLIQDVGTIIIDAYNNDGLKKVFFDFRNYIIDEYGEKYKKEIDFLNQEFNETISALSSKEIKQHDD